MLIHLLLLAGTVLLGVVERLLFVTLWLLLLVLGADCFTPADL